MAKEKESRSSNLNLLGIPLDPTMGIGDKVLDHINKSIETERQKEATSKYWARCPSCAKKVVREDLIKKGCYVCGWKGTESELEMAEVKKQRGMIQVEVEKVGLSEKKQEESYYTICSRCGHNVITEELIRKGCFICGYKPSK